jgi:hypothetical protein
MNLRMFSDADLITSLKKEVLEERKKMMSVLEHLREVDRRKLYAEHECSSLWEFCIKELKYSSGSVGRRVRAMKALRSQANPSMNYAELFEYMADEVLKKIDPLEKRSKVSSAQNEAVQQTGTTSLARSKPVVWKRDQGKCSFKDPETGRCCDSTYFLEIDHIIPVAMGGSNEPSNLRLRCRGHNQRYAVNVYGVKKMESYQMK